MKTKLHRTQCTEWFEGHGLYAVLEPGKPRMFGNDTRLCHDAGRSELVMCPSHRAHTRPGSTRHAREQCAGAAGMRAEHWIDSWRLIDCALHTHTLATCVRRVELLGSIG